MGGLTPTHLYLSAFLKITMKNIPPLFHISFNKALPTFLYPRQPSGLFNPDDITKAPKNSIFAEHLPPRISFSPSVAECFRAIWPNIHKYFTKFKYPYMEMYVYTLVKGDHKAMYTPEFMTDQNKLWDAFYTKEHCFLTKVKVKKLAKIRIYNTIVDQIHIPMIHPFNNKDYDAVKGSPDPRIKIVRVYDDSSPLVIKSLV